MRALPGNIPSAYNLKFQTRFFVLGYSQPDSMTKPRAFSSRTGTVSKGLNISVRQWYD
jgi:hypothetical protein